jgi:hypothetical protein
MAPPCNPRWGPFRPSRLSRSHRTPVVSLLSDEWLARQTDAVTTPSADFCRSIRDTFDSLSLDFGTKRQISRGKFLRLPRTTAEFTFRALDGYGLHCQLPARPTLTPQIRFLYVSSRVGSMLLSDAASRQSTLHFTNPSPPSGWIRDLHPQAEKHARHTTRKPFDVLAEGLLVSSSRDDRIRTCDLLTPSQAR